MLRRCSPAPAQKTWKAAQPPVSRTGGRGHWCSLTCVESPGERQGAGAERSPQDAGASFHPHGGPSRCASPPGRLATHRHRPFSVSCAAGLLARALSVEWGDAALLWVFD